MNKYLLLGIILIITACSNNPENEGPKDYGLNSQINWYAGVGQFNGSLDFGNLTSEQNKILTVTIKNVGDSSLMGPATISGTDFFLAYQNCATLLPSKSCTVKISFNVQGKLNQSYSENLTIGTQSALVTASVNLPAVSTELEAKVGGTTVNSLEFGTIKFDQSVMKTLIITNKGKNKGPWVVGQSGNGFVVSYDTCSNKEILPTKSCTLKISLSGAGKSGEITDTLTFGNLELPMSATVKNIETVSQEDSDIKVILDNQVAEPGAVDLGTWNLNKTKILNLYLKNEGTDKGIIEEPEISPDYQIAFNNCEPGKVLNAKASCLMKLVTIPQNKGVQNSPLILQGQPYNLQSTVREPGDKIFCPMDNALEAYITWDGSTYSDCVIEECDTNYHEVSGSCIPNDQSCSIDHGTGNQSWLGSEWSQCQVVDCELNYHTEDELTCVSDTRSCFIANGAGTQTWNGTEWNTCQVDSCNPNYYKNIGTNSCDAGIVNQGSSTCGFVDNNYPTSCKGYKAPSAGYTYQGCTGDGLYMIKPTNSSPYAAWCDMTTDNGGWTLNFRGNTNYNLNTTSSQFISSEISTNATEVMVSYSNNSTVYTKSSTPYKFNKPAGFDPWNVASGQVAVTVTNLSSGASAVNTLIYGYCTFSNYTTDAWACGSGNWGRFGLRSVANAAQFNNFPYYSSYSYSQADNCAFSGEGFGAGSCSSARFLLIYFR